MNCVEITSLFFVFVGKENLVAFRIKTDLEYFHLKLRDEKKLPQFYFKN